MNWIMVEELLKRDGEGGKNLGEKERVERGILKIERQKEAHLIARNKWTVEIKTHGTT